MQVLSLNKSNRSLKELLKSLSHIESLNLSGCYSLSESILDRAFTRPLPALTVLNFSLCKEVNNNTLHGLGTFCQNLEDLDLGGCSKVTNEGMFCISLYLRKLKRLNLRSCRLVSDKGVAYLAGKREYNHGLPYGLKELRYLGLQDCQKITDEGLDLLSEGMQHLEEVNLSFCVNVTDTGIKSLGQIPSLQVIHLRSCDNVSDLGIGFLAQGSRSSGLRSLDISFCTNITDSSARLISVSFPNLACLSMINCSLGDEGLIYLAHGLKKLESLNIGQCKAITDKSLTLVASKMLTLSKIDLYGCCNVSQSCLQRIGQMPKMLDLNVLLHAN